MIPEFSPAGGLSGPGGLLNCAKGTMRSLSCPKWDNSRRHGNHRGWAAVPVRELLLKM